MHFLLWIFIFSPFVSALLLLIMIGFQKKNKGEGLEVIIGLLSVLTLFTGFYFYTIADLNDWFKEENGKQAREISILAEQNKELKKIDWERERENKKLGQLAAKSEELEQQNSVYYQKYKTLEEEQHELEEKWQGRLKAFEDNLNELAINLNQTAKTE